MRQGKEADVRALRDVCGLGRGLMHRLAGALGLLVGERRLRDQHLGSPGSLDDRLGRCRVTGDGELSSGPWRTDHLFGRDRRAVRKRHCFSMLQPRRVRARSVRRGRPRLRRRSVPGLSPRSGPAERSDAVCDGESGEAKPVTLEDVAGLELDELAARRRACRRPASATTSDRRGREGRRHPLAARAREARTS